MPTRLDPRFRYESQTAAYDPTWGSPRGKYGPGYTPGEEGFGDGEQVPEPLNHDALMRRSRDNGEQFLTTGAIRAIRAASMAPTNYLDVGIAGAGRRVMGEGPGSLEEFIATTADHVAQIAQEQHDITFAPPSPAQRKAMVEAMARPVGSDAIGFENRADKKYYKSVIAEHETAAKKRKAAIEGDHADRDAVINAVVAGIEDSGAKVSRQYADDCVGGVEELRQDAVVLYNKRNDDADSNRAWRGWLSDFIREMMDSVRGMASEPVQHDYSDANRPDPRALMQLSDSTWERLTELMRQGMSHAEAMQTIRESL